MMMISVVVLMARETTTTAPRRPCLADCPDRCPHPRKDNMSPALGAQEGGGGLPPPPSSSSSSRSGRKIAAKPRDSPSGARRANCSPPCARASDFIFSDGRGRPLTLSAVSNSFRRRAACAGLKGLKLHSLRHAFDPRLGEAGRSPYEIARLISHSDIKTPMTYVHASGSRLREALETVSITKVGQPPDTKISAAGCNSTRNLLGERRLEEM